MLNSLAPKGYVCTDLERSDVDVRMSITDNIFRDDLFDFVICSHVLEHVQDDFGGLREIRRVLKPGGRAVLLVPVYDLPGGRTFEDLTVTDPAGRLSMFGQFDHVRSYGKDFKERLVSAGFQVEVVSPDDLTTDARLRFGVKSQDGVSREDLYLCTKPLSEKGYSSTAERVEVVTRP